MLISPRKTRVRKAIEMPVVLTAKERKMYNRQPEGKAISPFDILVIKSQLDRPAQTKLPTTYS